MRPDQTASTLWTTNWSCTTRRITPTTEACRLLTGFEQPGELLPGLRSGEVRLNFPSDLLQTQQTSPTLNAILDQSFRSGAVRTVLLDPTEHFALSFLAVSAGKGHSDVSRMLSCIFVYLS